MSPNRWATTTRVWVYRYLVLRDGERCANCGKAPTTQNATPFQAPTTQNALDIDHIDGSIRNNDPSNLRLLCRSCNISFRNNGHKQHGTRVLRSVICVREREEGQPATRMVKEDCNYREASPEMQANSVFEVPFRTWVLQQVTASGHIERSTAINQGAEIVGCSPTTTSRYLGKLTSPSGPLLETRDALGYRVLVLKEHLHV